MLIGTGNLTRESLAGQVAVVTGAGGGIGYEAARSLAWLGARVIIAEVDRRKGREAAARMNEEFGAGAAIFVPTDIGDERSVDRLARRAVRSYAKVDIVINNATIAPLGAVRDVPIAKWDASYRVNLRGPVLLARAFLPGMLARDHGVFACVSSAGLAYMGVYEVLKTAQVGLADTLDAELEDTGVIAFTIGPGLVKTATAQRGIEQLAPLYGKTVSEFYDMLEDQILSVEAAGAGFAAAVALAERYRGQEIGSVQALLDAGIELPTGASKAALSSEDLARILPLCKTVRATLAEQSEGWMRRSVFERQYMIRAFIKHAGMPIERWLEVLEQIEQHAEAGDADALAQAAGRVDLGALARFYGRLYEMAKGYIKDPAELEENLQIVGEWKREVEELDSSLGR